MDEYASICESLARNRLFKDLSYSEVCRLLEDVSYSRSHYNKKDIIAMEGDPVSGQIIMLEGSVRGEMTNYMGKVVKIEDIVGCQLLAPAFLYGGDNHYPVDIIANKETECIFLMKMSFGMLLRSHPEVERNYLDIISTKTQFLSNKIKFLALQPIKGKIASYLIKRTRVGLSNTLELPYSQEKLADLFGVTRPALARAFKELHQGGIISAKGKKICILNREKLEELIQ